MSLAVAAAKVEYGSSSVAGVGGGTSDTGAFSGTVRSEVSFVIRPLPESPSMVLVRYEAMRAKAGIQAKIVSTCMKRRRTTVVVGKDGFFT
jgi:hypothetical protein